MKKNILIVDDDQRLRELIKDYLVEKNFNIFLCEDFINKTNIKYSCNNVNSNGRK